jgi:hypothetical protein
MTSARTVACHSRAGSSQRGGTKASPSDLSSADSAGRPCAPSARGAAPRIGYRKTLHHARAPVRRRGKGSYQTQKKNTAGGGAPHAGDDIVILGQPARALDVQLALDRSARDPALNAGASVSLVHPDEYDYPPRRAERRESRTTSTSGTRPLLRGAGARYDTSRPVRGAPIRSAMLPSVSPATSGRDSKR